MCSSKHKGPFIKWGRRASSPGWSSKGVTMMIIVLNTADSQKPRLRHWPVLLSASLAGSSVVVVHSAESACSLRCPLHLSFSCSAVPLNVPSASEKPALLMASLCSVVCDSQQKDDRLCFFFYFLFMYLCLYSLIRTQHTVQRSAQSACSLRR